MSARKISTPLPTPWRAMDGLADDDGDKARMTTQAAPPCVMVIFGAAGDLTKRLLMPSLYALASAGRLPDAFRVVGLATREKATAAWREELTAMMTEITARRGAEFELDAFDASAWKWLMDRIEYMPGDIADDATYSRLADRLRQLDGEAATAGNYLFYLAIPDALFGRAVDGLAAAGLAQETPGHWRRVVIEKPFGHDVA